MEAPPNLKKRVAFQGTSIHKTTILKLFLTLEETHSYLYNEKILEKRDNLLSVFSEINFKPMRSSVWKLSG